jgi:hypothetical protein
MSKRTNAVSISTIGIDTGENTLHMGAPTALPRLLGLELTEYVIQPWQMQQIANDPNFPAVYQLLPSPNNNILFDTSANKYIPYNDPQVVKAFGLSTQNLDAESCYSQALEPANKPQTVSYFFIYGTGQWTDEYLEVAGLSLYGASARQDEQGDGTVPSWSVVRAAAQFSPHIPLASFLGSHVDVLQSDAFRQFLYSYFGLHRPPPLVTGAAGVLVSLNKRAYTPGETIHVLIVPDEEASVISGSLILHRISSNTQEANILGIRQEVTFRGGPVRSLTSKLIAPRTPGVYRLDFGGQDSSHKTSSEVAGSFVVPGAKRSYR